MYQDIIDFKPLFLSEEETMALLDLCLTSPTEIDVVKEQVIQKLTDLARSHMRANEDNGQDKLAGAACALRRSVVAPVRVAGDSPSQDTQAQAAESVSPITMLARAMARSHAPRRHMGVALADSRRRMRNSA